MNVSAVDGKRKQRWTRAGAVRLILFGVVLAYLSVPMLMLRSAYYPEAILFHPLPSSANKQDYDHLDQVVGAVHREWFLSDRHGGRIHVLYWRAPGDTHKVIIVHHGNSGNVGTEGPLCAVLLRLGADVLAYDYSGYGKSTGRPALQTVVDNGITVSEWATTHLHYQASQVIHYGVSLGSGVACTVAQTHPCGLIILQSAIGSMPDAVRLVLKFLNIYPDAFFPEPHLDNVAAVRNIHCPVVIIQGAKDNLLQQAQQIFASANEPKRFVVLNESGHGDVAFGSDLSRFKASIQSAIAAMPAAPAASTAAPIHRTVVVSGTCAR